MSEDLLAYEFNEEEIWDKIAWQALPPERRVAVDTGQTRVETAEDDPRRPLEDIQRIERLRLSREEIRNWLWDVARDYVAARCHGIWRRTGGGQWHQPPHSSAEYDYSEFKDYQEDWETQKSSRVYQYRGQWRLKECTLKEELLGPQPVYAGDTIVGMDRMPRHPGLHRIYQMVETLWRSHANSEKFIPRPRAQRAAFDLFSTVAIAMNEGYDDSICDNFAREMLRGN